MSQSSRNHFTSKEDRHCAEAASHSLKQPVEPETHCIETATTYSPSLLDMTRMQQWQVVLRWCHESNRKVLKVQAKQIDAGGLYPLHWACSGRAPSIVVSEILRAYQKAARKRDQQGSTALHFACHYGASVKVIKILLEAYPKSAYVVDRTGRTALFHAVHKNKGCSLDTLQVLIEANPTSVLKQLPTSGHTPLYVAWMDVVRDHKRRRNNGRSEVRSKKWEKAVFLLWAAFDCIQSKQQLQEKQEQEQLHDDDNQGVLVPVLHLLSYLPTGVLQLVVDIFPEQVRKRDSKTGQLPLSLAAAIVARERADDVIKILLDSFPQASQVAADNTGRTYLELAVFSGKQWDDGVDRLFQAAPESISIASNNPETNLTIPLFALSAMSKPNVAINCRPPTVQKSFPTTNVVSSTKKCEQQKKGDQKLCKPLEPMKQEQKDESVDMNALHLSTVYRLLRNDPSVIHNYARITH